MRRLTAVLIVCAASGAAVGPALAADERSGGREAPARQPPTALWQQFPLGQPGSLRTTQRPALEAPRSGRPTVASPGGGQEEASRGTLLLALTVALEAVGIAAAGVALNLILFLIALALARGVQLRRRREVAPRPSKWINYADYLARWTGGSEQPGEVAMDDAERSGAAEADGNAGAADAEQATSEQAGSLTAADIGVRVSGILKAAEETADQIRAEARDAAAAIRLDAEADVAAKRSELEQLSAEVEAARETRREAEEEARRMVKEAEHDARARREEAETMAKHLEAARARVTELEEHTGGLETYLREVVSALHESSSRLESVIAEPSEPEQETLLEALDVERRPTTADRS